MAFHFIQLDKHRSNLAPAMIDLDEGYSEAALDHRLLAVVVIAM